MKYIDSELLFRYCDGQCTKEEEEKVRAVLGNSTESSEQVEKLCMALVLGKEIKEIEAVDVKSAYQKTHNVIKVMRTKQIINQLTRYAAFLAVPLLLSSMLLGYLYFGESSNEIMRYAEIEASTGSVIRYELPDGSVVWLNAGSKLRYPITFSREKREVDLQGEAYFEVKSDKAHPFYVNTPGGVKVYVYGTRFNVNAYDDESCIETVLESGHVNVIIPRENEAVELEPGERFLFNKRTSHFSKSIVNVYEKTAWKEGKLIFRDTPLEEILNKLSRHFNVDIQFNNRSGKEYKYRATFRSETLPQILDYLSRSATMKWEMEESVQQPDETFTKKRIIVNLY